MSIVKMKRLKLIAMASDRMILFEELMRLGTVEITETAELLKEPEWAEIASRDVSKVSKLRARVSEIDEALDTLDKYVPEKRSIFTPRPEMKLNELFDIHVIMAAIKAAKEINNLAEKITHNHAEESGLNNKCASLTPWQGLDLPLDAATCREAVVIQGVCPASTPLENLTMTLEEKAPLSELFSINTDKEQHYLLLICHKSEYDAAMGALRHAGFSRVVFKDVSGTASECIENADRERKKILSEREGLTQKIILHTDSREVLRRGADRIGQELIKEQARDSLLATRETFLLEGWTPAVELKTLDRLLKKYDCWYELKDPQPGDNVPVKLHNSKVIEPFNMVTEMYGFPQYTNIDPNPLIAPFFAMFFGIMYGDVGYGLILLSAGIAVTARVKLKGALGQMFRLMRICGITTILFGIAYGSFFGDAIPAIAKTFFGMPETYELKMSIGGVPVFGMIDLLEDPLTALIIALGIGALHMLTGMAVKAYLLIRDGRPLDALMDIGSWWLTFAGIGVFATGHGPTVVCLGVAALILTQGRKSKNIGGKVIGGFGSLYNIIQYMSDVLSYSRLMALALASYVIAMVFNILASLVGGTSFFGVILFVFVFLFGHAFNMGVNLISTYVHGARLQYLEYFNRFYVGGGSPFKPFTVKTRFIDIIKEE